MATLQISRKRLDGGVERMQIASLEDDPAQSLLIREIFLAAGYDCTTFSCGEALLDDQQYRQFTMLVIDWELPGISGYEVVRLIRQHDVRLPILFLTSRSLEEDIVNGLEAGADDYMIKPVRRQELIARARALLRRTQCTPPDDAPIEVGGYVLDPVCHCVTINGQAIDLSHSECAIANLLFRNVGSIVSRDRLDRALCSAQTHSPAPGQDTVESHLSRLRAKLMLRPENGVRISPVYTHGYRFETISAT